MLRYLGSSLDPAPGYLHSGRQHIMAQVLGHCAHMGDGNPSASFRLQVSTCQAVVLSFEEWIGRWERSLFLSLSPFSVFHVNKMKFKNTKQRSFINGVPLHTAWGVVDVRWAQRDISAPRRRVCVFDGLLIHSQTSPCCLLLQQG